MMMETVLSRSIRLMFAGGMAIGLGVLAQPALAQSATDGSQIQRVEITGSSIKRVLAEQALPVTVISRDEIERSGVTNMEQLVATITSASTAGATTGSQLSGSSTYGIATVSLRGLGSSRTLVLLNGRRIAPFGTDSQSVDINSVPLAAIERVEVLSDGASSVYGSEAIAGVINFITRQNYQGAEVTLNYGDPTRSGGGSVKKASAVVGFGDIKKDGYNFMVSAGETQSATLMGRDRSFSKSGNVPPFLTNGATGQGNVEGVWVPGTTDRTTLTGPASRTTGALSSSGGSFYGNPTSDSALYPGGCASIRMFQSTAGLAGGAADGRFKCNYDSAPDVGLFPKSDLRNFNGSFDVKLNPSTTLFGSFNWSSNVNTNYIQPAPARSSFFASDNAFTGSGVDPALVIFPSNPNYPKPWLDAHGLSALDTKPLAVTMRAFAAGPRTTKDTANQSGTVFGFKGTFHDWDYQTAFTHNESTVNGTLIDGFFSQLGLARAINTVGNTAGSYWNPWSNTQPDALAAAIKASNYVGPSASGSFKTNGIDFKASGEVGQLTGGAIGVAFGANLRNEQYNVTVPAITGSGDIAGAGGATLPQQAARNNSGIFGEVNLPFMKNLEVTGSVRADHYDDLKSDNTPITEKLSARWTPVKSLIIRGSVGTGFRAPSLNELHQPSSAGTSEQFTDPLDVASGPIQVNSTIGGNENLKPEKSTQGSLGLVFVPTNNIRASVDYFQTNIKDMIVAPTALGLLSAARAGTPLFGPNDVTFTIPYGQPGYDPLQYSNVDQRNHNAAKAKFEGFDVAASWSDKFAVGRLGVDYNATYMTRARLTTLSGVEEGVGTMINDATDSPLTLAGNGVVLRYKHTLSFNWAMGPWGVTLTDNHTSGYRSNDNQVDGAPHHVPSLDLYDMNVSYTGIKNLKLAVGARNLFDKNPPIFIPANNQFQNGYDASLYDPRARFVYVTGTYKF